jgi:hypothetical protein
MKKPKLTKFIITAIILTFAVCAYSDILSGAQINLTAANQYSSESGSDNSFKLGVGFGILSKWNINKNFGIEANFGYYPKGANGEKISNGYIDENGNYHSIASYGLQYRAQYLSLSLGPSIQHSGKRLNPFFTIKARSDFLLNYYSLTDNEKSDQTACVTRFVFGLTLQTGISFKIVKKVIAILDFPIMFDITPTTFTVSDSILQRELYYNFRNFAFSAQIGFAYLFGN